MEKKLNLIDKRLDSIENKIEELKKELRERKGRAFKIGGNYYAATFSLSSALWKLGYHF